MSDHSDNIPVFGEFALPGVLERLRRFGCSLHGNRLARIAASGIRRICLLRRSDPIDVEAFPGQRVRLYPRDNLSEKRVFGALQLWDAQERDAIADAVNASDPAQPFVFVDAGANVGLYTLFARSATKSAGRDFTGLAIEPDPENRRRLRVNLALSGATDVYVSEKALSDREGEARLEGHADNRGQHMLGESGVPVLTATLETVVREASLDRIDALKMDIEGVEEPALRAFLASAPAGLWPKLLVIEALRGEETDAMRLCLAHGYEVERRSKMNVVLRLVEQV